MEYLLLVKSGVLALLFICSSNILIFFRDTSSIFIVYSVKINIYLEFKTIYISYFWLNTLQILLFSKYLSNCIDSMSTEVSVTITNSWLIYSRTMYLIKPFLPYSIFEGVIIYTM